MSRDTYFGYYHTDYTLPTEYFQPDVERPAATAGYALDFTYLHRAGVDNPAHTTMGEGHRIRHDDSTGGELGPAGVGKRNRMAAEHVSVYAQPLLDRALAARPAG
jgi:hypothetical protein